MGGFFYLPCFNRLFPFLCRVFAYNSILCYVVSPCVANRLCLFSSDERSGSELKKENTGWEAKPTSYGASRAYLTYSKVIRWLFCLLLGYLIGRRLSLML